MKVSELMQAMSDAGAPMEAILIAVRAIEEAEQRAGMALEELEAKRTAARDKKRRQRSMSRDKSDDVPGPSRDTDGTVPGPSGDCPDQPSLSRPPNENNSNPPTHTHPECESPRTRKADPFPRPEWADPAVWSDLLKNRKSKRLTNTATAHTKFIRDLMAMVDDEWPPGRLLEAIVARGWGGAYDPRETRNDRQSQQQPVSRSAGPRGERPNPCLDMFLAAEQEIRATADSDADWQPRSSLRALPSS
ncbi:hypothetical protein GCM10011349_20160 [Novosphingobium indicum]|uniref:Uncharacterized protein n=1 Tax=Novosphingobium indicum TaxID=462949 RepID=A0ABQ2JP78_9SPHN|nr:hypothetical protein GCM10011349_20160 [Novosphingobium indicum]